jgi:hypothetical protein
MELDPVSVFYRSLLLSGLPLIIALFIMISWPYEKEEEEAEQEEEEPHVAKDHPQAEPMNDAKDQPQEKRMSGMKEYFTKHRDTFFTIAVVVVLDHFIFKGALRSKLQSLVERLLEPKKGEVDA